MKVTLLTFLLVCLSGFITINHLRYSGNASDLYSGQFYYTELHRELEVDGRLKETVIDFADAEGKVIVHKTIDYSKNVIRPDFIQEDIRDGNLEGASTTGDYTELRYRRNFKSKTEMKRIRIPEPAVVDGGFNNLIKEHWDELKRGDVVKFNFAIPSRLDYYAFRLSFVEEKMLLGKQAVVYKMEPDKFILRTLVSPVIVTYNTSSRRLMQYEGLSNINDASGKSYTVKINFPVTGP